MTFFDCTADLVGLLNGNGQKLMLHIDAAPVENFWLRHCTAMGNLCKNLVKIGRDVPEICSRRHTNTQLGQDICIIASAAMRQ